MASPRSNALRPIPTAWSIALLATAIALWSPAVASPPGKTVEALIEDLRDEDPDVRLAARGGSPPDRYRW